MSDGKKPFWFRFVAGSGSAPADAPLPYAVYTTAYDLEIDATDLDSALGPLSGPEKEGFDAAFNAFENGLAGWRMAFDIECVEAGHWLAAAITREQRRDTVVSFLIDHSGSMKGQRLLMTAAAISGLAESLLALGAKVEILGFTTTSWKGGRARDDWKLWPKRNPGRLCELMHIIYRHANTAHPRAPLSLREMLRPDLPKENVDGEAVEWAAARLRSRLETRKVLLVMSDGAPVDDSTILANGEDYLPAHLKRTVASIEAEGDIAIGVVDICSGYAKRSFSHVAEVDDLLSLGTVALGMIKRLLAPQLEKASDG
jgi:cobaltochelatase CobT